jgi:hypothetical protein
MEQVAHIEKNNQGHISLFSGSGRAIAAITDQADINKVENVIKKNSV